MVISVSLSFGVLLAALQGVYAQTAPGFSVSSSSQSLNVTFGTNNVSPPGELIPRPGMYALWCCNQTLDMVDS